MKNAMQTTNTAKLEWAKHLRAFGKRRFWKRARKNGKITKNEA